MHRIRQRSAVKVGIQRKRLGLSLRQLRCEERQREGSENRQTRSKAAMHTDLPDQTYFEQIRSCRKHVLTVGVKFDPLMLRSAARPAMIHHFSLALVAAFASFSLGCRKPDEKPPAPQPPPTERLVIVKSLTSPCLNGMRPAKEPTALLRQGDLVEIISEKKGRLSWKEKIEGVESTRDSDVVLIRRSPGNEQLYAFTQDFGETFDVPAASVICEGIDKAGIRMPFASCPESLQRHRSSSGRIAAFVMCVEGPCPVAVADEGKINVISVDGMNELRPMFVGGRTIFLATHRFRRDDGKWTGASLVPIDVSGAAPVARPEIQLDDVDARDATIVRTRTVQFEVKGTSVRVFGERAETERDTGTDKSRVPFEETHSLVP